MTCDKLGVKFHKPAEFFGRIKLAAFEAANILSANGHTYYTGELFHYNIQRILNSGCYAEHVPTSAVLTAIGKDYLQEVDGQNCIIHPQKYLTAEKRIAKNIRRLASASCENQSFSPDLILYAARACKMNYGEQQRSAFPMVLRKRELRFLPADRVQARQRRSWAYCWLIKECIRKIRYVFVLQPDALPKEWQNRHIWKQLRCIGCLI